MLAASIARAHAVDAALPEGGVKARIKMWQKAQQAITVVKERVGQHVRMAKQVLEYELSAYNPLDIIFVSTVF